MIKLDIDCTKLSKERLKDGKYAKLVCFDKPSERSDGFIAEDVTKEERESGVKGKIVGNWKRLGGGKPAPRPAQAQSATYNPSQEPSEIPF